MVIRLFCDAGMSTTILVRRMREAASKKGKDDVIDAYPMSLMKEHINGADVVLIGPQVAYELENAKTLCDPQGILCEVISSADFAMADGMAVLKQAHRLGDK